MFETISFLIALVGSALAGLYDLKITPTEIPDEIPYAMIGLALVLICIQSVVQSNFNILAESLMYGISLLLFGYVMYRFGQWGGGDAKILAAIGFLSPNLSSPAKIIQFPFALSYLINVFLIGAVYMLVYALVMSLINRKIIFAFFKSVKSSSNLILISSPIMFLLFLFGNWSLLSLFDMAVNLQSVVVNSIIILFVSIIMFLIWFFVKAVEETGFKKRIPISQLRIGDVLLESKVWEGITGKELKKIKKSGKKSVWIKSGVCFAPVFPLALLFTLYFGDGILYLIKFLI